MSGRGALTRLKFSLYTYCIDYHLTFVVELIINVMLGAESEYFGLHSLIF